MISMKEYNDADLGCEEEALASGGLSSPAWHLGRMTFLLPSFHSRHLGSKICFGWFSREKLSRIGV